MIFFFASISSTGWFKNVKVNIVKKNSELKEVKIGFLNQPVDKIECNKKILFLHLPFNKVLRSLCMCVWMVLRRVRRRSIYVDVTWALGRSAAPPSSPFLVSTPSRSETQPSGWGVSKTTSMTAHQPQGGGWRVVNLSSFPPSLRLRLHHAYP